MVWLRSFVGLWRSFLIQGQRKVFLLFLNRQMKTIDLIGVNRNDGNQHEQSQLDRVLLPVLLLFREASQKSKMKSMQGMQRLGACNNKTKAHPRTSIVIWWSARAPVTTTYHAPMDYTHMTNKRSTSSTPSRRQTRSLMLMILLRIYESKFP